MKTVSLVGSTGSVGRQAVDVIQARGDEFEVFAIGARASVDLLVAQAEQLHPSVVAIADDARAAELKERVASGIDVVAGPHALEEIARGDVVLNGVVGFAGLAVSLAALEQRTRLALANKESLVAGGHLVRAAAARSGSELVPVDSEHSAIHQCLRAGRSDEVARLVITASGGPFRGRTREELRDVTPEQALGHPTWDMGDKITIDSSTLMNKGLEVIEAHELFGLDYDRIDVVVHPQSILHSAVQFVDGSAIGQLSAPDMRLPISYALGLPDRRAPSYGGLDLIGLGELTFEAPDRDTFVCLDLAYEAGRTGGAAPAWLNAANEVAVQAFLDKWIPWLTIGEILKDVLGTYEDSRASELDEIHEADRRAREVTSRAVQERAET